jgi:vacuolar-type H+-ATPase subunit F/Vma7
VNAIIVVGEPGRVAGFALAGARTVVAEDEPDLVAAWDALDGDVAMVLLTPAAAAALEGRLAERPDLLVAVLP